MRKSTEDTDMFERRHLSNQPVEKLKRDFVKRSSKGPGYKMPLMISVT